MIEIIRDPNIETFLKYASSLLYAQEDEYGLILGVSENIQKKVLTLTTPPLLLRIVRDGKTTAVAMQTPPFSLLLSHIKSEELEALIQYLKQSSVMIPGVMAPSTIAHQFSKLWGKEIKEKFEQKLYCLNTVIPPTGSGKLLLADVSLQSLLAKWYRDFSIECLPSNEHKSETVAREHMENYIANASAFVLMDKDKPVSMAITHRKTKNGASIGYVYSPPELRKQGYASLTVAQLSQKILDSGKTFCVLYTDVSNPTSNKIYQDIGYREVSDSLLLLFHNVNSKNS